VAEAEGRRIRREGEEEEGEDEGRWDKGHSGLWAQPLPAAHNYDNSPWVLSLVRPTCSPSAFIYIFLFSDSRSSPAPPPSSLRFPRIFPRVLLLSTLCVSSRGSDWFKPIDSLSLSRRAKDQIRYIPHRRNPMMIYIALYSTLDPSNRSSISLARIPRCIECLVETLAAFSRKSYFATVVKFVSLIDVCS